MRTRARGGARTTAHLNNRRAWLRLCDGSRHERRLERHHRGEAGQEENKQARHVRGEEGKGERGQFYENER